MFLSVGATVVAAVVAVALVNLLLVLVVSFWVVLGRRSSGKKNKTKMTRRRFLFPWNWKTKLFVVFFCRWCEVHDCLLVALGRRAGGGVSVNCYNDCDNNNVWYLLPTTRVFLTKYTKGVVHFFAPLTHVQE